MNSDERMLIMLREASAVDDMTLSRSLNGGKPLSSRDPLNQSGGGRTYTTNTTGYVADREQRIGQKFDIATRTFSSAASTASSMLSAVHSREGSAKPSRPVSLRMQTLPDSKKGDRTHNSGADEETVSQFEAEFGIPKKDTDDSNCCLMGFLMFVSVLIICLMFPFSMCIFMAVIKEHERAVKFRLGKVAKGRAFGPGILFLMPCIDRYELVDLRTVSFDVPPQEILTLDSVSIAVDAVVYFRIFNSKLSVIGVEDATMSTRKLAATTLRNILGTKTLEEILIDRDNIASDMLRMLDEGTDPWGVHVERVELKDVRLPVQLQRAMAAEAEAAREAKAKVIAAQGEMFAAEALQMAADKLDQAPASLELRFLQELNNISAEKNQTIVIPFPKQFVKDFLK